MFRLSPGQRSRRTGTISVLVAALVATLALVACMPASASNVRVRHSLFGMHDGTPTSSSYGQVHEGALRLWDVGVQWQQVETSPHHYQWGRLDQLVSAAHARHAEVTMVVAGTPSFYSGTPWNVPAKQIAAYKAFVKAMMNRYRPDHWKYRGIAAYQVWNEANIKTFWSGSVGRMAELTRAMDQVRDHVDRHVKVIGPAMVTRLKFELKGLASYYHQRVGGLPVWRYVDAVGLSLYPQARYGRRAGVPEDSMGLLRAVKKALHRDGVPGSKPIWNTEINYGLGSGSTKPISAARQASNVMRTYLLNAAAGVKRIFWYRYDWGRLPDGGTLGNTLMTSPDSSSAVTPAGKAYLRAQQWMHGTLLGTQRSAPCAKDTHGTYTCVVKDGTRKRYIYWNPFHGAKVRLPKGVHHLQGVLGGKTSVKPRSLLKVAYKPVMVSR
jgi:hypothetical protein